MQNVHAGNAAIPAIGFGTYGMTGDDIYRMIPEALRAGFRHIDTGQIYRNEAEIGDCVAASGIPRSEMFLTTKVWVSNYSARHFDASVNESLRKLKTDYIDLLLLHWPGGSDVPLAEQIGELNEVVRAGKVRHIGVSNFNRAQMTEAIRLSAAPLVTNQFEYHPYLNQSLLIESTREAGLAVTGYCGMAVGRVFSDPTLKEIAARHDKTIAQIVLRWLVQQRGVVALSRTTRIDRLAQNLAVFDFELDNADMAAIQALATTNSRIVDPPGLAPRWDSTAA
ncbi:aldo/keto reductase [Paraburkholderia madseniana]|jgi:diketogulonate reductase-like aldo/keto reductase|uniref:Aldo/keto reductase n=1 Tax=Paraburkholderia madseniana TaxID=2599607 RepID=A0AAP5BC19_9BURK|nr:MULTISPECIES: aldo/keto reductase [Paraburkholderia]MCX4145958.1 aldo/keto reductase [Paraburkholderia madseniana]MDN7148905.1 aldo/keto reductase [Paraburkholderia sp. WS6]MDQ6407785.1 aldo/keto reductase [Paraburkholderia madseniana]